MSPAALPKPGCSWRRCRDWMEELLKDPPDWEYLNDLHDWIEETEDVIADFELDESMGL